MNITFMRKIENMEKEVTLCNGRPEGRELPQVATERDILDELSPRPYL